MNDDDEKRVHAYALRDAPGHLIRRCQQRAVDLFVEEVGENGPTPRQFAVLLYVHQNPGTSQTALVQATGIDRSTLTEILRRMIQRNLISRTRLKEDMRANALTVTAEGAKMLTDAFDAAMRSQDRILEPLPAAQRDLALELLARLAGYGANEIGASAAPDDTDERSSIKTDAEP